MYVLFEMRSKAAGWRSVLFELRKKDSRPTGKFHFRNLRAAINEAAGTCTAARTGSAAAKECFAAGSTVSEPGSI